MHVHGGVCQQDSTKTSSNPTLVKQRRKKTTPVRRKISWNDPLIPEPSSYVRDVFSWDPFIPFARRDDCVFFKQIRKRTL